MVLVASTSPKFYLRLITYASSYTYINQLKHEQLFFIRVFFNANLPLFRISGLLAQLSLLAVADYLSGNNTN